VDVVAATMSAGPGNNAAGPTITFAVGKSDHLLRRVTLDAAPARKAWRCARCTATSKGTRFWRPPASRLP
jgi:hypothetical protein